MLISSRLIRGLKPIYEIQLSPAYDAHMELKTESFALSTDGQIRIDGKLLYMPGICLIEGDINTKSREMITADVDGEHFLFNFIHYVYGARESNKQGGQLLSGEITKELSTARKYHLPIDSGDHIKCISIIISVPFMLALLKNESWDYGLFLKNSPNRYLIDLSIRNIIDDLLGNPYTGIYHRPFFELKLKELFFKLHVQAEEDLPDLNIPYEVNQKLLSAKAFLVADFVRPPTIRQLARIVSLNEFKLKQYFKTAFGITIHHFVIKLRMQQAERMLLQSFSVTEVSEKIGYRSVSHFIDTFKKHYGKTPSQLSRSQKNC